jgi:hypothetical protein
MRAGGGAPANNEGDERGIAVGTRLLGRESLGEADG